MMSLNALGLHRTGLIAGLVVALVLLALLRYFRAGWLVSVVVAVVALVAAAYGYNIIRG